VRWLLLVSAAACLAGCHGGDDAGPTPPPQKMLNPSAKPQTAEQQQTLDARREAGARMNQDQSQMAQQIAAAKARTGGK